MVPLCVVVCALFAAAAATDVQQCPGRSVDNLRDNVQLQPCERTSCKLKRGTDAFITLKFTTDKEIKELKNQVSAEVFGVPLPFIGVDGSSVCGKLKTESGEPASCPLPPGTYVYSDSFPVLPMYPTFKVKVHWALKAHGKDVACFEVPVSIVNV